MFSPSWYFSMWSTPYDGHDYWKYVEGKVITKPTPPIKPQAPRQSFRQSMRSVNRNR